jgi:hypothetical protein
MDSLIGMQVYQTHSRMVAPDADMMAGAELELPTVVGIGDGLLRLAAADGLPSAVSSLV